jgi:hypothetical protein
MTKHVKLAILFEQKRARFIQKRTFSRQRAAGNAPSGATACLFRTLNGHLVIWSFGPLVF